MDDKFLSCCFTGYRPSKFEFNLDDGDPQYVKLINRLTDAIFSLPEENCFTFYCGMAMGFDIIAGETVTMLRRFYPNARIELVAVIPFEKQADTFDEFWKERYYKLLKNSDRIIYIGKNYKKGCYAKRNFYMIDNSDIVITWYDGKVGGTLQTLDYAQKNDKKIVNLAESGVHEYEVDDPYIIEADY